MSYYDSLTAIINAEARYCYLCGKHGEGNGPAIEAFNAFQEAKRAHRTAFGSLVRVNGQWV